MKTINRTWLKNRLNSPKLLVKAGKEPVLDGDDWSSKFRKADDEWVRYIDVKDKYPYSMIYDKVYGYMNGGKKDKPYYKISGDKDGIFRLHYKWLQSYTFKFED